MAKVRNYFGLNTKMTGIIRIMRIFENQSIGLMKRILLFTTLIALCACGNNSQQGLIPIPEGSEGIAFQAFQAYCALNDFTVDAKCPEDCILTYRSAADDIEGYYEDITIDCFPRLEGGWIVIETWEGAAEGEATGYNNTAYLFKDGKLEPLEDFLPVPTDLDLFLCPEACEGQEEMVNTLAEAFRDRPKDFLVYFPDPDEQTLRVELRPLDPYTEESINHVWPYACWEIRKEDSEFPVYRWNGKTFVPLQ